MSIYDYRPTNELVSKFFTAKKYFDHKTNPTYYDVQFKTTINGFAKKGEYVDIVMAMPGGNYDDDLGYRLVIHDPDVTKERTVSVKALQSMPWGLNIQTQLISLIKN